MNDEECPPTPRSAPVGGRQRRGRRGRVMLVGAGGIVVGLAIGSVAIVAATSYAMQRTVDRTAEDTANAVVAMIVEDGQLPAPLPVPTGQVVQVLDGEGHVR